MFFLAVNFDHFQILRAIGKGSFGKVRTHTHTTGCDIKMVMCAFLSFWLTFNRNVTFNYRQLKPLSSYTNRFSLLFLLL